jgi:hypothetical protein
MDEPNDRYPPPHQTIDDVALAMRRRLLIVRPLGGHDPLDLACNSHS